MSVVVVTRPVAEPVTVESLRSHVRGSTEDNALISSYGIAAREAVENETGRTLGATTYRLTRDKWPSGRELTLPRSPLRSSTSVAVTYRLSTGSTSTLSSTAYVVDGDAEPPRLILKANQTWPENELLAGPSVRVQWDAGYAGSSTVPERAKQAIRFLAGHWYENRETVVTGTISSEVQRTVRDLLWSLKVPSVP